GGDQVGRGQAVAAHQHRIVADPLGVFRIVFVADGLAGHGPGAGVDDRMHAAGPVVGIVVDGGVVDFGGVQRCADLGFPALASEGPGYTGIDLVTFLVVLA